MSAQWPCYTLVALKVWPLDQQHRHHLGIRNADSDAEDRMMVTRGKGGGEVVKGEGGHVYGNGRRCDFGRCQWRCTMQCTDNVV